MSKNDDDKVTDFPGKDDEQKPTDEGTEPAPIQATATNPTHWALPISTVQAILRYLKKRPMEDVEQFVYDVQDQAIPFSIKKD